MCSLHVRVHCVCLLDVCSLCLYVYHVCISIACVSLACACSLRVHTGQDARPDGGPSGVLPALRNASPETLGFMRREKKRLPWTSGS